MPEKWKGGGYRWEQGGPGEEGNAMDGEVGTNHSQMTPSCKVGSSGNAP